MVTYSDWLEQAQKRLEKSGIDSAKIDARFLLEKITMREYSYLFSHNETVLSVAEQEQLEQLLQRRLRGEPIAYIVGEKGFWSFNLMVSDQTLIPRPDTECLVETTLDLIKKYYPKEELLSVLDLGTGTGAIALALATELHQQGWNYQIIGVDRIQGAVELAKQNAEYNQIINVKFLLSDWFSALSTHKFHIIVSNPPYIAEDDPHLQQGDVRFEPKSALVSGNNGLADIEQIITQSSNYLYPQGWLLIEHGWQQANSVQNIFKRGDWQQIQTIKDYGDNQRVTLARME